MPRFAVERPWLVETTDGRGLVVGFTTWGRGRVTWYRVRSLVDGTERSYRRRDVRRLDPLTGRPT